MWVCEFPQAKVYGGKVQGREGESQEEQKIEYENTVIF
jgi:hypothetical protein